MEPITQPRSIDYAQSPFEQWEIVTVTWLVDGQAQRIPHSLRPNDPRDVRYILIQADREMTIEDDLHGSGYATNPWTLDSIVLTCHATLGSDDNSCQLLLFVPRTLGPGR